MLAALLRYYTKYSHQLDLLWLSPAILSPWNLFMILVFNPRWFANRSVIKTHGTCQFHHNGSDFPILLSLQVEPLYDTTLKHLLKYLHLMRSSRPLATHSIQQKQPTVLLFALFHPISILWIAQIVSDALAIILEPHAVQCATTQGSSWRIRQTKIDPSNN